MNTSLRTFLCFLEKLLTLLVVCAVLLYTGHFAFAASWGAWVQTMEVMAPVVLGLVILGCFFQRFPKMVHRRRIPAILYYIVSVFLILFTFLSPWLPGMYVAGGLLVLISAWNLVLEQKFSKRNIKTIKV